MQFCEYKIKNYKIHKNIRIFYPKLFADVKLFHTFAVV